MNITGKDIVHLAKEVEDEEMADFSENDQHYVEMEVYNHVSVMTRHYVNSVNGHESFAPTVTAGDSEQVPDYVTERIAEYLWMEWGIEVSELEAGIQVIDPEADDVHRI